MTRMVDDDEGRRRSLSQELLEGNFLWYLYKTFAKIRQNFIMEYG